MNIDVLVDNPTGCVVSSVKIVLMRVTTTFKADGSVKTDTHKVKVHALGRSSVSTPGLNSQGDEYFQGGRFPMKEEKYEGSLEFVIPSDAQPSINNQSGGNYSFTISYDLIVKAAVKWHDDVELVFPITITPRL